MHPILQFDNVFVNNVTFDLGRAGPGICNRFGQVTALLKYTQDVVYGSIEGATTFIMFWKIGH